jgi:hypothetical protein
MFGGTPKDDILLLELSGKDMLKGDIWKNISDHSHV